MKINTKNVIAGSVALLMVGVVVLGFIAWLTKQEEEKGGGHKRQGLTGCGAQRQDHMVVTRQNVVEVGQRNAPGDRNDKISKALHLSDREARWSNLAEIAHEWADEDPYGALAWAMSLENVIDRQTAMTSVYLECLKGKDLSVALEIIEKIPQGEFRDNAIVMGIRRLSSIDMDQALTLAKQISGQGMLNSAARMLAGTLIQERSSSALTTLLNDLPYGAFRSALAKEIVSALAAENPKNAMDWLMEQHNVSNSGDAVRRIAIAYANEDPIQGVVAAQKIKDEALRKEFMQRLGNTWARMNPASAGAWLTDAVSRGGYNGYAALADGILDEWVQWSHDTPFQEIEKLEEGVDKEKLLLRAAAYLGNFDPEMAATRMERFFNSSEQSAVSAYRDLARNWLERDSVQCSTWIANLQPGPSRDATIEVLVNNILQADGDVVAAMEWATQIQSDNRRNVMQKRIGLLKE